MQEPIELWDYAAVSIASGLSVATLRTYRAKGKLPKSTMTKGGSPLWFPEVIIQWLEERKQ